jgi:hypothetical protein
MARPLPHRYPFDGYNYAFLLTNDPTHNEKNIANVRHEDRSAAVVEERYLLVKLPDAAEIARLAFDEY